MEMRQLGLEPGVELVELGPVTPPPEIAERLGLKAGDKGPCPTSSDVRRGQPMQLATSYVPWSLAEGTQMVERDSGPGGISSRLADVGHGPVRFAEEVATRMPTPRKRGSSGSWTRSRSSTWSGRPSMCRGHRSRSASTSCRVIAGCSPTSGPRTSVLTC